MSFKKSIVTFLLGIFYNKFIIAIKETSIREKSESFRSVLIALMNRASITFLILRLSGLSG